MKNLEAKLVDDLIKDLEKFKGQGKVIKVLNGMSHYTIKAVEEDEEIQDSNEVFLRI